MGSAEVSAAVGARPATRPTTRTLPSFVCQLSRVGELLRGPLFGLLLGVLGGCQSKSYQLPIALAPSEAKLVTETRAEKIKFSRPDSWELEEQPTSDANITILGGLSPDNKSLLLFVSLRNVDPEILRETELIQLAKEKFFNNAEPLKLSSKTKINNLTGTQAEFASTIGNNVTGTFGNNAQRAFLFAGHYQGAAFIFIVATEERSADQKTEKLLQEMLASIKGE